jgi:anoctamin-10
MAFINNIFETRGDAFKIAVHNRRAIPSRTDTIGPWLDVLTFLTWLGAITNSALVYLFSPQLLPDNMYIDTNLSSFHSETLNTTKASPHIPEHFSGAAASGTLPSNANWGIDRSAIQELLLKAILVSLVASHGFILLRTLIRHIVDKVFWRGSGEVEEREKEERNVKAKFLSGSGLDLGGGGGGGGVVNISGSKVAADSEEMTDSMGFWDHDEGLEEIQRISKEA